ncbi:MAG: DEAD/DEAH box helicase, partial [Alphaproteobacteria bacterium]|nr:DEAD/DEAH box helicase [Alphaproteobacteria bacterium]
DTPVTLEELQRLADANQTHYMSGETLIPVNVDQLHEFLRQVKKIQKQKITPFDLLRADVGFGIQYNVSSGWLERVMKQLRGQTPIKELDQPQGLKANLRPYQVRGFSWLCFMRSAGLGACLADDMGLGKTIQTISYMLHVRENNKLPKKPFLLVCPTSLLSNWQRELETFAPGLNFHVHHGSTRDKESDFFETDIVITSYSLADRDLSFLKPQLWEGIILDEAQNIKNANAKQTRALKMLNARHRIILTGTPIENRPTDIWSLMDFANHGLLGNKTWFNSHYGRALSYSNKKEQQEQAEKVAQQLKGVVAPFMLRRLKTDNSIISDLPDRINHKIVCKLSLEQTSLYKACVDNMLSELNQTKDGLARRGLILTTLMRLKQICNHPAQFTKEGLTGESGKLDVLHDLLDEIMETNEKVLIFTQFKEMGTILNQILEKKFGKHIPFLNGSTPAKDRGQMVEDFQKEDGSNIFILSLKAGGIGLNLTAANHVIHYDRWWNPAVEDQATSRAHRIGQKKIVSVHTFICNGT